MITPTGTEIYIKMSSKLTNYDKNSKQRKNNRGNKRRRIAEYNKSQKYDKSNLQPKPYTTQRPQSARSHQTHPFRFGTANNEQDDEDDDIEDDDDDDDDPVPSPLTQQQQDKLNALQVEQQQLQQQPPSRDIRVGNDNNTVKQRNIKISPSAPNISATTTADMTVAVTSPPDPVRHSMAAVPNPENADDNQLEDEKKYITDNTSGFTANFDFIGAVAGPPYPRPVFTVRNDTKCQNTPQVHSAAQTTTQITSISAENTSNIAQNNDNQHQQLLNADTAAGDTMVNSTMQWNKQFVDSINQTWIDTDKWLSSNESNPAVNRANITDKFKGNIAGLQQASVNRAMQLQQKLQSDYEEVQRRQQNIMEGAELLRKYKEQMLNMGVNTGDMNNKYSVNTGDINQNMPPQPQTSQIISKPPQAPLPPNIIKNAPQTPSKTTKLTLVPPTVYKSSPTKTRKEQLWI